MLEHHPPLEETSEKHSKQENVKQVPNPVKTLKITDEASRLILDLRILFFVYMIPFR